MMPDFGEPAMVHDATGPGAAISNSAAGTQTFTTARLDDAELAAALAAAGLRRDRHLTEDRSWLRAVPVIGPG